MRAQIQEVYAGLGKILENPQAFGLGEHVPNALAEHLESLRRMLQQAQTELCDMPSEGDLAFELSQDADRRPI
jgi:hypothetical protein